MSASTAYTLGKLLFHSIPFISLVPLAYLWRKPLRWWVKLLLALLWSLPVAALFYWLCLNLAWVGVKGL